MLYVNIYLQTLRQSSSRLENRTQLVTLFRMGPKVFINSAGFIKIDTDSFSDRYVPSCGWMDDLQFYTLFNCISVISE